MAAWIWVLVPLVAIIGGYIIDYQKNKMKMMELSERNEEEVDELRAQLSRMQGRLENLEAIAAADPASFNEMAANQQLDLSDRREAQNRDRVATLAQKSSPPNATE